MGKQTKTKVMKTLIVTIIACVSGFFVWDIIDWIKTEKIEVGQTWRYSYGEDNPYEKPTIYYYKVMSVSGDYVQYTTEQGDTMSSRKHSFLVGSELIEK